MNVFIGLRLMGVELALTYSGTLIVHVTLRLLLINCIREAQPRDLQLEKIRSQVREAIQTDFVVRDDGMLLFGNWLCVPNDQTLRRDILEETHSSLILCIGVVLR